MEDTSETRGMKFRLGLMIIVGFIILVVLIVIFSDWQSIFSGNRYKINVLLPNAPGVKENTPVRQSGILIGRVRKVALVDQGAMVTVFVDTKYKLYNNQVFRLSLNILGDAELNVMQTSPKNEHTALIQPGSVVSGFMAPNMMDMAASMQGNIIAAIDSITQTSQKLNKLLSNIDAVFNNNQGELKEMIAQTIEMGRQARELITKTNIMLSDPEIQKGIHDTVIGMPEIVKQAQGTFAKFNATAEKINLLADSFNTMIQNTDETMGLVNQVVTKTDKSLGDFNNITGTISERKDIWLTKVGRSLDNLDNALLQISEFTTTLNSSNGTVGKLVKDSTLYDNLNQTLEEIRELKRQLDPIVANMQTFSDKVARNPEQLGVAGAMRRSSGTKGVPPIPSDLQGEFQRFRYENASNSNGVIYQAPTVYPSTQWESGRAY